MHSPIKVHIIANISSILITLLDLTRLGGHECYWENERKTRNFHNRSKEQWQQ